MQMQMSGTLLTGRELAGRRLGIKIESGLLNERGAGLHIRRMT